jgi:hypothetical protein
MAIVWAILGTVAVVFSLRCLYNLYLHPLSKFPGPKLAAIGSFYEFYYDVIKDGTFLWKTEEMHRKYGRQPKYHPFVDLRRASFSQPRTYSFKVQSFGWMRTSYISETPNTTVQFMPEVAEEWTNILMPSPRLPFPERVLLRWNMISIE